MVAARAALTVSRHSRPAASASWAVAKAAFQATTLCSIRWLATMTGAATGPGLPAADAERIFVGNAGLNM